MSAGRPILLRTRDPLVERRVARVAGRLGLRTLRAPGAVGVAPDGAAEDPAGLLVELDLEGALDVLGAWRKAFPQLPIVAYVAAPDRERWERAEELGADVVTSRGLADRELGRLVEDHLSGVRRSRRLRLAPYRDFAGRLGFVGRVEESPAGPIAVYQLGQRLYAVSDACPHAGASLCEGEIDGDVVTCPRHGSQFRITDGERVRGPADLGIETFPVVVEGGEVFVELPDERPGGPVGRPVGMG